MTTTPTASPQLPDLDRLEALARAATPGPWSWWTSNSTLRLTGADGRDGGVLYGYARQGDGDVNCAPNDQAFIAAANPAAVLALIALARRAQPEGEAPQAVAQVYLDMSNWMDVAISELPTWERKGYTTRTLYPAATLSPLCGAQHAESGKEESESSKEGQLRYWIDRASAAEQAFVHARYDISKLEKALAAQQAAAPVGPLINEGTSAPGTPEARYKWFRDWYLRGGLRMEINPWGHVQVTTAEMVDKAIDAAIQRAAQLDGGQEGSGS